MSKKALRPSEKREFVDFVRSEHDASILRGCRITNLSRTSYAYKPDTERNRPLIEALQKPVEDHPRWGFRLMFDCLRRDGHRWNHKHLYRIYAQLKLSARRNGTKRLPIRNPQPLAVPEKVNQSRSIDFTTDALADGRLFPRSASSMISTTRRLVSRST